MGLSLLALKYYPAKWLKVRAEVRISLSFFDFFRSDLVEYGNNQDQVNRSDFLFSFVNNKGFL